MEGSAEGGKAAADEVPPLLRSLVAAGDVAAVLSQAGDIGEIWGRYRGDIGEIQGRYS